MDFRALLGQSKMGKVVEDEVHNHTAWYEVKIR